MKSRRNFLRVAALAAAGWLPSRVLAQSTLEALPFSSLPAGAALPGWLRPQAFVNRPRPTEFSLVEDGGQTVLRARAHASASGLVRELRVDPAAFPFLAWRWKVMNLIDKADLARKAGDDFPARLYVSFDLDVDKLSAVDRFAIGLARMRFGPQVPVAVLCYVWDGKAPAGTFAANAYTGRVHMIVAESGATHLGQWVSHERDIAQDFKRAFGIEAPAVSGVIVSSDTDDTGESTEAYFGDVEFRARATP